MIRLYIKIVGAVIIISMIILFGISGRLFNKELLNEYVLYDENLHVYILSKEEVKEQVEQLNKDTTTTASTSLNGYSIAEHAQKYIDWIVKYSNQYNVDPILVSAMCSQETDFGRYVAVSSAGATGLMQFQPTTWAEQMPGRDINDPESSVEGCCKYIAYLWDSIGRDKSMFDVAYAYNAGDGGYKNQTGGSEAETYRAQVRTRYEAYKSGALSIGYKYSEGD